jgi:ribonuclease HI
MSGSEMKDLFVFTDGACLGNPGPGGWGYVVVDGINQSSNIIREGSDSQKKTTNNRMELLAAIEALESISRGDDVGGYRVTLYTDSQYVSKGITEWIQGWIRKGWFGSNKKPVKNKDLWLRLLRVKDQLPNLKFMWVKGHNGNHWNEYVDKLANDKAGIDSTTNKN